MLHQPEHATRGRSDRKRPHPAGGRFRPLGGADCSRGPGLPLHLIHDWPAADHTRLDLLSTDHQLPLMHDLPNVEPEAHPVAVKGRLLQPIAAAALGYALNELLDRLHLAVNLYGRATAKGART